MKNSSMTEKMLYGHVMAVLAMAFVFPFAWIVSRWIFGLSKRVFGWPDLKDALVSYVADELPKLVVVSYGFYLVFWVMPPCEVYCPAFMGLQRYGDYAMRAFVDLILFRVVLLLLSRNHEKTVKICRWVGHLDRICILIGYSSFVILAWRMLSFDCETIPVWLQWLWQPFRQAGG